MPSGTKTSFGQYSIAEPVENLGLLHHHDGVSPLREVDHEPPLGVLDQEDLTAQGIDTATLVAGAPQVDALGSCTANATTVAVSNLGAGIFGKFLAQTLGSADPYGEQAMPWSDTVTGEKAAICFYHDETGETSTPWPPNDDGCTGPVLAQELVDLGIITTQKIAHSVQDICSLLQSDGVLEGGPFLNAWMDPPASAIVDGNGTLSEIETQIRSGVAGGHETYISGISKLSLSETGAVIAEKTILQVRNSWSKNWGDQGSFFIHASTLVALGTYFDFRQLVA